MKLIFKINAGMMVLLIAVTGSTPGQVADSAISEVIAITARPFADSITLRWAPLNFNVWQLGNNYGYTIERYVIARNGSLLRRQEKSILHPLIKPLPEDQWEILVNHDKYAAIAAQALFGDRFEIDLRQSDIFSIVNKVHENEQRYAFALFSADMSPGVAMASGLLYTDKQVKKTEKYLYRVMIHSADSLRGSIFISPDNNFTLPKPQNFKADFKEQLVSLRWDKTKTIHYTAYILERSDDGKQFTSISDSPLITVSPVMSADTRYDYAIDSLKDLSKIYYYRVKGITPFGEQGPPSDVVSGKGTLPVNQVPYISSVESIGNKSFHIYWDFPSESNRAINGFSLERSSEPTSNFSAITPESLPPETRSYEDNEPHQVNYYRVSALGIDGETYPSHVYYAQLVDSLPPASPGGLKATVDDEGIINLSWNPNMEPDIYGYRIYRAHYRSEELAQITSEPISENAFTDYADLNTLNKTVYYSVMSIDKNQNHSALSELLKVSLPDKIKPMAPVLLPVQNNSRGVVLTWIPSGSEDVIQYAVYRKDPAKPEWIRLEILNAGTDTTFYYLDENGLPGKTSHYTVVAIDDAGLESDPAHPVSGGKTDPGPLPALVWKKPVMNREQNQVTLRWIPGPDKAVFFRLYKATGSNPPVLYKTLSGKNEWFTDILIPGNHYTYQVMAIFEEGRKSMLSEALFLAY